MPPPPPVWRPGSAVDGAWTWLSTTRRPGADERQLLPRRGDAQVGRATDRRRAASARRGREQEAVGVALDRRTVDEDPVVGLQEVVDELGEVSGRRRAGRPTARDPLG